MDELNFEWDAANLGHIDEHDVKPEEAEQVLLNDPLELGFETSDTSEERWAYLGETYEARILQVIIALRGERVRVVTAYDAPISAKRLYLKTKADQQNGSS
jgi:uncharacterized DUF497 family protein